MRQILRHTLEGPVKSLFGGSSSRQTQTSTPQDMTPPEFTGLRGDVAQQLQNIFASGGGAQFQGPTAAQLTGNEQGMLDQIMQMTSQPSGATQAGQDFLQNLLSGGGVQPGATPGGIDMSQANPFLQQAIEAAQRPLIEQYQEQIAPALRAQFTQAGQQLTGTGSSPFHMAAAREQAGMANALGDISTRMSAEDWAQRQGLASQEFQQQRALEMEGQQQRIAGAAQAANIDRSQLENVLAGLEAQALPRLIEQLGIDRGMEEFRRREEQLLQAIQMAGQLASPTVATVSRGESTQRSTPNIFSSLFPSGFQG